MISIRRYSLNAFRVLLWVALMVVCATSCGKDDNAPAKNSVMLDPAVTVKPDSQGNAILLIAGTTGTKWTAEITAGDWVSFDLPPRFVKTKTGTVGESLNEREQFIYYVANPTKDKRTAQVTFTFEGQTPVVLELVQYSVNSTDNIYESGQARIWPEIPVKKEDSNFQYVTHYAKINDYNARNYTLCFDKSTLTADWVAYPLHNIHTGTGRPAKDPWAYDPKIGSSFQANLARGSYQTGAGYDRGHQIPNADRNGNMDMQYQTFYCSNATPQVSSFNQGVWLDLEGKVRDYICSDTLYVVTGAYFANSNTNTTDKDGKRCPVPTNYFKVLVRTTKGNIRKKGDLLSAYSDSQLISIGFWYDNRTGYPRGVSSSQVLSVKDIEQKTGFTFFPQVSDAVKSQRNPLAWGIN